LMALVESNMIKVALAARPEEPTGALIAVLNDLAERLKTLDEAGHDLYRRSYRLLQPWQSTHEVVRIIRSDVREHRRARGVIVDALNAVFTEEDAMDLVAMAKELRPELVVGKEPNFTLVNKVFWLWQRSSRLKWIQARDSKIKASIREVLDGFVNDSSNE